MGVGHAFDRVALPGNDMDLGSALLVWLPLLLEKAYLYADARLWFGLAASGWHRTWHRRCVGLP
jgi:hypothetical protein